MTTPQTADEALLIFKVKGDVIIEKLKEVLYANKEYVFQRISEKGPKLTLYNNGDSRRFTAAEIHNGDPCSTFLFKETIDRFIGIDSEKWKLFMDDQLCVFHDGPFSGWELRLEHPDFCGKPGVRIFFERCDLI